jgi:hypothetical protein
LPSAARLAAQACLDDQEQHPDHAQCKEDRLREYPQNDNVHNKPSNRSFSERLAIRYGLPPVTERGKAKSQRQPNELLI